MNFFRGVFWGLAFEAIIFGFAALAVYAVLLVVG